MNNNIYFTQFLSKNFKSHSLTFSPYKINIESLIFDKTQHCPCGFLNAFYRENGRILISKKQNFMMSCNISRMDIALP